MHEVELSNVKLKVTLAAADRTRVPHNNPLEGTVKLSDFEARSLEGRQVSRVLDTFVFINDNEGYHAQRTVGDNYRITGYWTYGDEEVLKTGNAFGHRAFSVRVVESPAYTRPQLRVVSRKDDARSYAVA